MLFVFNLLNIVQRTDEEDYHDTVGSRDISRMCVCNNVINMKYRNKLKPT